MRFTAQEEYGLRCLLAMARDSGGGPSTIEGIARAEGLSAAHVGKLLRVLRKGGLVQSIRGQKGGYRLARPAREMSVAEALRVLGGRLYAPGYCRRFTGVRRVCVHDGDCTIRPLWARVELMVEGFLGSTMLAELAGTEHDSALLAASRGTAAAALVARPQVAPAALR